MTDQFEDWMEADFVVASVDWTAAQLETAVGLIPDRRGNKGQVLRPGERGRLGNSFVRYDSGLSKATGATEQLEALVTRLEPAKERLRTMLRTAPVYAHLSITGEVREPHFGGDFPPMSLAFLADLGLTLHLSLTFHEGAQRLREEGQRRYASWRQKQEEC